MNRIRQGIAMITAGALLGAVGLVAQAATADACDPLFKSSTIANLKAYEACRFDRIDAANKAIMDKLNATPPPSPTQPPVTPTPVPSSQPPTPTQPPVTPTPTPTQPPAPSGVCDPSKASVKFTNAGSQGIGGNYDVSLESWGTGGYNYSADLGSCSHDSWYVNIKTDNAKGDGAVKSYPSMRKIYHDWSTQDFSKDPRLSSFKTLTVDHAFTDPGACAGCIYEEAYDNWLNGISSNESTEQMIWVRNFGQTPYGAKVKSGVSLGGHTWDIYSGNSNGYVAWVPTDTNNISAATIDVKAFTQYQVTNGLIHATTLKSSTSTVSGTTDPFVGQISFGVEPVSTGGVSQHWDFSRFTVNDGS